MTKPCGRPVKIKAQSGQELAQTISCAYPRMRGKQRCVWHWLAAQPAGVQKINAEARLGRAVEPHRARVPETERPVGERWCSGCQSFVPLFYCSGSRCKSCASSAAHASRVEKVYGISGDHYDALLRAQGGKCFICQRPPGSKRLAVDHDHETGAVRGLLCASNEFGCNRAILGNIRDLAMARRILLYLDLPPYERYLNGLRQDGRTSVTWADYVRSEVERVDREAREESQEATLPAWEGFVGSGAPPPPF